MLHQIKAPQFYTNFLKLISLVMQSSISEVEFQCVKQYFHKFSVLENLRNDFQKSLNFHKLSCMKLVTTYLHFIWELTLPWIGVTFCRLLITLPNSLDPDQDGQNVGPDLDPNCLTL